jgi:hypothetical protein
MFVRNTCPTLDMYRASLVVCAESHVRGFADKSLARPRRKQATAMKLGIYSTYSTRSTKYFLVRCSNFCKPLKKNKKFFLPTRFPRLKLPLRRKKNDDCSIEFSVLRTDGSPTGPDRENRVGDQDIGTPGRPVLLLLQVPGGSGCCRERTQQPS